MRFNLSFWKVSNFGFLTTKGGVMSASADRVCQPGVTMSYFALFDCRNFILIKSLKISGKKKRNTNDKFWSQLIKPVRHFSPFGRLISWSGISWLGDIHPNQEIEQSQISAHGPDWEIELYLIIKLTFDSFAETYCACSLGHLQWRKTMHLHQWPTIWQKFAKTAKIKLVFYVFHRDSL